MKKLNMGRLGLTFCLVSAISISSAIPALADWEQQTDGNWKYKNDDGSYVTSSLIDGYYVNDDGIWITDFQSDWKNTETWKNEKIAKQIGSEIQEEKNFTQNPIRIENNSASYGDSSPVIKLSKNGTGNELELKTALKGTSKKGFQALCYLICNDDTLFNYIMSDYENEILQNDTWTKTEYGFSIMVHTENGLITYSIKLD